MITTSDSHSDPDESDPIIENRNLNNKNIKNNSLSTVQNDTYITRVMNVLRNTINSYRNINSKTLNVVPPGKNDNIIDNHKYKNVDKMSLQTNLDLNITINIDFVSYLPNEISEKIFCDLPPKSLLNCRRISKSWKQIIDNDYVWRTMFQQQKTWKYYNVKEIDSWFELYKNRYLLQLNWKNDNFKKYNLIGHFDTTYCIKFFKNWILTGSRDHTIRIWDNDSLKCLRVLGKPNPEIIIRTLSTMELIESTKNIDFQFHNGSVLCMDINDNFLVSGSSDGSCIIWKLPDFKPIERLILPRQTNTNHYLGVLGVALYNDYITCCYRDGYIGVWKSSLDNLENQPHFNLQHCFKRDRGPVNRVCIHDGIIYSAGGDTVERSWNIETGELLQEFRGHARGLACVTVSDNGQYLIVGENKKVTVWDLNKNKIINVLSGHTALVRDLCINDNNKIISASYDCTIKIWNLNDNQKLLKEYKNLQSSPVLSVCSDSKRLATAAMNGDIVIIDFSKELKKKYLKHL